MNFLWGRIVTKWRDEQALVFLTCIRSRQSANHWAQTLIHELWHLYFALWLQCNEAYHSDPTTENKIQLLSKINQEIRRQWAIGSHGIPKVDKHHFTHIKLAQLLREQLHYKQQWLYSVTQVRQSKHQTDEPYFGVYPKILESIKSCTWRQYWM